MRYTENITSNVVLEPFVVDIACETKRNPFYRRA